MRTLKGLAVILLVVVLAVPAFAEGRRRCPRHVSMDSCSCGYENDFKLMAGAEVNLLHPNWQRNIAGDYLKLKSVDAGFFVNSLDPAAFEDMEGRVTARFNLFGDEAEDPIERWKESRQPDLVIE